MQRCKTVVGVALSSRELRVSLVVLLALLLDKMVLWGQVLRGCL